MGAFVAIATVWLEQEVGFWTSYLLPLCMFVVGMAAFIAFQRRYGKFPHSARVFND